MYLENLSFLFRKCIKIALVLAALFFIQHTPTSNSIKSIFSSCSFNMSSDSVNVYGKHTVEVEPILHYRALTIVLKPHWRAKFLEIGNTLIVIVNSCHKAAFFRNELRFVIFFLFYYIKSFPLSGCLKENRLWWC